MGIRFLRESKLTLSFATNTITSNKDKVIPGPSNYNYNQNHTELKSKILVDYVVEPFSTNIIFAKVHLNHDVKNEIQCCELELSLQTQFNDTVIYQVLNRTAHSVELADQDILAVTISESQDKEPSLHIAQTSTSAASRAKTVYDHLLIKSNPNLSELQKKKVWEILLQNHAVFAVHQNDIGFIKNYKHKIKINNEDELIKGNKSYPIPLKLMEAAKKELARLERLKIIERCVTKFAVPSFFVKKKSTGAVRLLNDFRFLNSKITPEVTCIAPLEVLLASFDKSNAKFTCVIDLADGFYGIELDENSRDYCSFTFPNVGSWRYKKTPLGLASSPSSMAFVVQRVLGDVTNCVTYVDDFLIFGPTIDDLIATLKIVLEKLRINGFMINYKKMKFGTTSCSYLGFNISDKGIKPLNDKVQAIKLLPPPSNRKGCQAIIGTFVYFSRFIENFSEKIRPLIDCIKQKSENGKIKPFALSNEAKQAFEKLKISLMTAPILKLPDVNKKFYIFTDSSQFTVGAALMQKYNDKFFPVSFYSRALTAGQQNYCAFLRELIAITSSIKHFRYYIEGSVFEVKTDSLILTRPKFLTKTQIRCALFWILEITERFQFTISWIKGSQNNLADTLSRIKSKDLPPLKSDGWYAWFEDSFGERLDDDKINLVCAVSPPEISRNDGSESDPIDNVCDNNGYFLQEQLQDESLAYIRSALEAEPRLTANDLPQKLYEYKQFWPFIVINKANLICIKWYDKTIEKFCLKIVAPYKTTEKILHDAHCSPTAGHLSYEKTVERVRNLFWWPKITNIVRAFCGSCAVCHEINTSSKPKPKAELKFWSDYGGGPGCVVSIDVFQTARWSKSNKYILVIIDKFSRYLEFTVMQNSRAPTIARALVKYFMQNGVPNLLLSDLGQELQGKIVSNILDVLKITRLKTTPFSPQTNGASERSFRTIRQLLQKFVSKHPNNYHEILPLLTYAINTAENSTTKISPFFLQRGYQPRPLTGLYWGITSSEFYKSQQHYQSELYKKIKIAHEFAMLNMRNKEFSISERWSQKCKYVKYFEGQKVYYFSPVANISHRKIRSPFHKAEILKAYPTDSYLIKLSHTGRTLMSSYRKLTLIPCHVQNTTPQVPEEEESDEEPNIDISSGGEVETEDEQSPVSSEEEFESADDQSPEERPLPRRSTRATRPVDRYQAKW